VSSYHGPFFRNELDSCSCVNPGYTTDLLTDAKTYANHAGRPGTVEMTDIDMAVQTRSGYEFTEGAPKDVRTGLTLSLFPI
jgi:hypothetical protein